MIRLGKIPWQALHRLEQAGDGLTTAALADIASTSVACKAFADLGDKGLASKSGTALSSRPDGRRKPRNVWVITRAGRALLAESRGS